MTTVPVLKLGYSLCWEDPLLDLEALGIGPEDTVVTIASAGCNALSLLGSPAASVVAVDYNPQQSALLELKVAAIRELDRQTFLAFAGESPMEDRLRLYGDRLAPRLSPAAREFWAARPAWIAGGIHHAGSLERHFAKWRLLMRWIQGARRVDRMFESSGFEERRRFFDAEWNRLPYRAIVRLFFNRTVLGFAKHPSHFRYITEPDIAGNFLEKCRHALVDLDVQSNYFLARIFLGRYLGPLAVPPYLTPGGYETTRDRLDRLSVRTTDMASALDELPPRSVRAFYLSNICEWLPDEQVERVFASMTRAAAAGARATLRTLLAVRPLPPVHGARWRRLEPLSSELLRRDRSFLYSTFQVLELA